MIDLALVVKNTPTEQLPALRGKLAEAEALILQRLTSPAPAAPEPDPEEHVLTYAEVAELLRCRESYVETLARQHKLPVVALPGTNRGGQSREGKFKRILLSSLIAHLKQSQSKALDTDFSAALNSPRDRRRVAKDPQAPRTQPDRVRRASGRSLRDREPVGDGRAADPADSGEAGEAGGGDAEA